MWRYANPNWSVGKPPKAWNQDPWVRIVWFALDQKFQGKKTTSGGSLAADFYASVEQRALRGPKSKAAMLVDAFCHHKNGDALTFWQKQGFTDIGPALNKPELRRLIHYATLPA